MLFVPQGIPYIPKRTLMMRNSTSRLSTVYIRSYHYLRNDARLSYSLILISAPAFLQAL